MSKMWNESSSDDEQQKRHLQRINYTDFEVYEHFKSVVEIEYVFPENWL